MQGGDVESRRARSFLEGGGETGALLRAIDWTSHPLGPPEHWPQSLKSAVSICLGSRFPILLWWGPDLFMIYNDAYRPMLGSTKHPTALGQAGRDCWPEIWDIIGPMLETTVLRDGGATWSSDQMLPLERNGFVEECYFTFTYSPIRDESGDVGGVFCAVIETTERVIGERRLTFLKTLSDRTAGAASVGEVCSRAVEVCRTASEDVREAGIYLSCPDGGWHLAASTCTLPDSLDVTQFDAASELAAIGSPSLFQPITGSGQPQPVGMLVAGLNRRRPLDADYRSFLALVAGQIGSAIAEANALESERARAEALAQLDRAKTAFFSNVSHEFRTPLTLMLGPLQDALESPSGSLDAQALASVHRNGLRLQKLVNALLDFARIEAGPGDAAFESVDLPAFTADLVSAFRSAIESAGLRFEVSMPPLPHPVRVDPGMWEKVVFNLLSNALKHTFSGRIRVGLDADGDMARLTVSDTGIGIPRDQQSLIFQRFHRVKGSRARTQEGAGIGLALVHELVTLHGGRIDVESEPGRGSTFTVLVPMREPAGAAAGVTADARPVGTGRSSAEAYVSEALGWLSGAQAENRPAVHPRPATRLVVADDNADMRAYLVRLLRERWNVVAVSDGQRALEAVKAHGADLVLADVMMPVLDGFQLLDALRADPETSGIPVVLLSARAGEEATLAALEAGADDYVVKPFSSRDLLVRIETQLTRAQQRRAARDRMDQVEALLNHAPLGVYFLDQDLTLAYVNPVALPAFGDIHPLVGRSFEDVVRILWRPEFAEEVIAILRRVLDTGEPHFVAERAERRADSGAMEYYSWQVVRVPFPDGRHGVVCYFTDISAQVEARNRIAESEARYRAVVTATSDVIYRMNPDWTEMRHLVGQQFIPDTHTPSRTWLETYIHPDDQPLVLAAIDRAVRSRSMFELEHRVIRVDGSLGWTVSRAVPMFDEEGRIVEWFGTARDVTARKHADEALERLSAASDRQRRLYRTILSNTPDLVYVFDRQHRFTYANDALLRMWGRTFDEAIGRTCLELGYPQWHAEMHDREIEQVIATKQPIRGEVPFTGADGRRIYDYIFVPVIGADGQVEAVAGTTRDVTDRKTAEDAARESEQRLAEANRAKDLFLATLSHELRTPLNAVLGWAHMLRAGTLSPDVRGRALAAIERNAQAQAQLVDDLLDLSRIMSGKLAVRTALVDLAVVVASAVDAVRPAAQGRSQVLEVGIDPDMEIIVQGDADRLQQVIWNLLSNAVKFTPEGGCITVTLGTDGVSAIVTVRDTGEGIDPAFLPRVFERFQQADSAPTRRHGGLGLGLAIVRHLVEAHGGDVSAESAGPGCGTSFSVRLPLHLCVKREPQAAPSTRPLPQTVAGVRVLLADHDADERELTRAALEARGAAVTTAASAGDALHAIRHQPFDVLIVDIGMPEQDGYALIRAVRSMPEEHGGRLPAIALHPAAAARDGGPAFWSDYDHRLAKPFDTETLVDLVSASLAQRQ